MHDRATTRPATETDLPEVVRNYHHCGDTPWNPFGSVERLGGIPLDGLIIAEAGGHYAGFLYWFADSHPWFDPQVERYAHVVEMQVLPEYARWFTGPLLVAAAFKQIEAAGFPTVYFDTLEESAAAKLLGDRLGFVGEMRSVRLRFDYPATKTWDHRNPEGMRMLRVFLVEIFEQARVCLTSFSELQRIIEDELPTDEEGRRRTAARLWGRIQGVVVSSTVISRILWPTPSPRANGSDRLAIDRGLKLRMFLKLQGEEPPNSRGVRNAFEHIDERLDTWQRKYSADHLPAGWILSPFDPEEEPDEAKDGFRYFNLQSMELRVGGRICNLREVVDRVRKIQTALPPEAQITFSPPPERSPDDGGSRFRDKSSSAEG